MDFELKTGKIGDVPVIELMGPLMDSEVYRFSRELKQIARQGHATIAIEVTHCDFMDSHALGLLVFHHNELQKQNRRIVVVNENPDPMAYMTGLLENTGLNQLFIISDKKGLARTGPVTGHAGSTQGAR